MQIPILNISMTNDSLNIDENVYGDFVKLINPTVLLWSAGVSGCIVVLFPWF